MKNISLINPIFPCDKRNAIILLCFLYFSSLFLLSGWGEPALNIPPKPSDALKGSKVVDILLPLSLEDREAKIYELFSKGNVPDFYRKFCPVFIDAEIGGRKMKATFFVAPDYLMLGTDDDYFLTPMAPGLAQKIANLAGCCLPTRKMVDDIYSQAIVKLSPAPIPPSNEMTTVKVFNRHNQMVWNQRKDFLKTSPLGSLVGGDKKDVAITNKIHNYKPPPRVAIYGWHKIDGEPIQPLSLVHAAFYADYSHGIRLVSQSMIVDGVSKNIMEVLADPNLAVLLSDEGPISNPRYPVADAQPTETSPVQAPSNLVRNGSFEEDFKMGLGQSWQKWQKKELTPVVTGEARKNVHDGNSAQYWARPDNRPFDGGLYQTISVKPGEIYEISAWLKKQSTFPETFMAFGFDPAGGIDGSAPSVVYTNLSDSSNNTWFQYLVVIKASGDSLTLFSRGGHTDMSGGDKAYFYLDHVSVKTVENVASPTPVSSFRD